MTELQTYHAGVVLGNARLMPHASTPVTAGANILCNYAISHPGHWRISFIVKIAPELVAIPGFADTDRTDELWKTTCFEVFFKDPESGAYLEFNLSPSGRWAAYSFSTYRAGRRNFESSTPAILTGLPDRQEREWERQWEESPIKDEMLEVLRSQSSQRQPLPDRFALTASLDSSPPEFGRQWEMGFSAIIEAKDGAKSYWALAHPEGKPDFHHPACFAAKLEPPEAS